jgi:hypothetical protein
MQIFKNSGAREVIVSSVQIELHGSVSRLGHIWLNLAYRLSLLEIAYLLGYWEIVHEYQPDERAILIAQFGTLLTNFGFVV